MQSLYFSMVGYGMVNTSISSSLTKKKRISCTLELGEREWIRQYLRAMSGFSCDSCFVTVSLRRTLLSERRAASLSFAICFLRIPWFSTKLVLTEVCM